MGVEAIPLPPIKQPTPSSENEAILITDAVREHDVGELLDDLDGGGVHQA